jgi:hypothetical protein
MLASLRLQWEGRARACESNAAPGGGGGGMFGVRPPPMPMPPPPIILSLKCSCERRDATNALLRAVCVRAWGCACAVWGRSWSEGARAGGTCTVNAFFAVSQLL